MNIQQFAHTRAGAIVIVAAVFLAGYATADFTNFSATQQQDAASHCTSNSLEQGKDSPKWQMI